MCLSSLHRVVSYDGEGHAAVVDLEGRPARVALLALDGPPPRPGEWLVVHCGYAIDRVADETARRALAELDGAQDRQEEVGS
ncbi:MAG TPA: HypC/HybG/HupF family hydrogenase formation chaperone [Acidimicrobiales bacterium]|nr:HypC/HybG/HupF family hydrogenase formation chaperone [Acidimicrobiales bacterium]